MTENRRFKLEHWLTLRTWRSVLAIYWVAHALATHWPGLTVVTPQVDGRALPLDKPIHLISYALLTVLIFLSQVTGRHRKQVTHFHLAIIITLIYAFVDEFTQGWFGRQVSTLDLAANVIGVGLVFLAGVLMPWMLKTKPMVTAAAPSHDDANKKTPTANVSDQPKTTEQTEKPRSFIRHAITVGSFTFLSRITGLARDAAMAFAFGLGAISDAFYIGFLVPNLFRRLFGEGALTAAFIPVYTKLNEENKTTARQFATLMVVGLTSLLGIITLILEALLWLMLQADWSSDTHLAIELTMWMLPYMPLVCVVALLGGMLQVHHRFGPAAIAPIVLNIAMIAALALATFLIGQGSDPRHAIVYVCLSVVLAGVIQIVWMLWHMKHFTGFARGALEATVHVKKVIWVMLPMIVGLAVFQINTLLDSLLAMALSPKAGGNDTLNLFGLVVDYPIRESGAVAALTFAQRLYQFPLGVFGIALATAIFPALARHAANNQANDFRDTLQRGLRLAMFIGLPASVGLIIVRIPLTRIMFERGAFSPDDAQRVAMILMGYAAGVWAYAMTHILTRSFYARNNATTPLRISVGMVAFNVLLNLMFIWYLGAAGLAWSTAICAAGQVVLLIVALSRDVAQPIDAAVVKGWLRTFVICIVMFAVLWPLSRWWDVSQVSYATAGGVLALLVGVGMVIVTVMARLMKMDELRWLLKQR